ncbi:MAG TPA: thioesterase family protein [Candidatus Thermoplasmatota archaeon]|nr:thioesterase family protein [Candidatus Thermoplasmatota archaeon]
MFPFLRLAKVVAAAPARTKLATFEPSVVRFRVWPGDLDQNRHLNNGRYLTMMDLGRFDLVVRTGLGKHLLREKWYPVVTAATIRFRRSLDPFQEYELITRMLGWDDRGFYLEQRFERDGVVHAVGVIKGLFLGPEGKVPTGRIVTRVAPGTPSPELPAWVRTWDRSQEELAEELRAGAKA